MIVGAAATRNTAYNAVMARKVRRLKKADYSIKEFNGFRKHLLGAALSVPSTLADGESGHVYLLLDDNGLSKFTKVIGLTQKRVPNPGTTPLILGNDSHAIIAQKTAKQNSDCDAYYSQEGAYDGLKDQMINNVPKICLQALEDEDTGFLLVTPRQMLEHLQARAEVTDPAQIYTLLTERDEPIDFEGEEVLATFF